MVKGRLISLLLQEYLSNFPAIGLLGPRQEGKTTLLKTAIEIKNTLSPKLSKGIQISMEDTGAEKGVIICRISESFPLSEKVMAVGLRKFLRNFFM
ncbi:MAG: hypothetical protein ACQEW9_00495 [Bacteroidota bacterium]